MIPFKQQNLTQESELWSVFFFLFFLKEDFFAGLSGSTAAYKEQGVHSQGTKFLLNCPLPTECAAFSASLMRLSLCLHFVIYMLNMQFLRKKFEVIYLLSVKWLKCI